MDAVAPAVLSVSWPGALAPARLLRPDPPQPPRFQPAVATWTVPPLSLPMVPRKWHSMSSSTAVGESSESGDEVDGEERCLFAFDGAEDIDDYAASPTAATGKAKDAARAAFLLDALESVGYLPAEDDDKETDEGTPGAPLHIRSGSHSSTSSDALDGYVGSVPLGASPTLISVLEQMALEAQHYMRRQTTI